MVVTTKSPHFDFYKQEVDRAIRDCGMWNDRVRLIVYTTIITETCDGRPFGWLNYTNPREPQFANFQPNDGDPPSKSWSTQRSGGLFQQQPQYWGPDVMNPYKSTVSFLKGYRFPDGRSAAGLSGFNYSDPTLPIWTACQRVQGSEFGDGSNYKRNIPYAQMVIDSSPNNGEEFLPMGNYRDPDELLNAPLISQGIVEWEQEPKESIRQSLWGTNRAVNQFIPRAIDNVVGILNGLRDAVLQTVNNLPGSVANEILGRRWPWWNQDEVAPENQGTNNIVENVFATNGRVYHPTWGNKALSDKLDLVVQLLQQIHPEVVTTVVTYNESHVGTVPVVKLSKEN